MRAQNTQIWTASPPIAIDTASEQIGGSWSAFAFTVSDLQAGILVYGQALRPSAVK